MACLAQTGCAAARKSAKHLAISSRWQLQPWAVLQRCSSAQLVWRAVRRQSVHQGSICLLISLELRVPLLTCAYLQGALSLLYVLLQVACAVFQAATGQHAACALLATLHRCCHWTLELLRLEHGVLCSSKYMLGRHSGCSLEMLVQRLALLVAMR